MICFFFFFFRVILCSASVLCIIPFFCLVLQIVQETYNGMHFSFFVRVRVVLSYFFVFEKNKNEKKTALFLLSD